MAENQLAETDVSKSLPSSPPFSMAALFNLTSGINAAYPPPTISAFNQLKESPDLARISSSESLSNFPQSADGENIQCQLMRTELHNKCNPLNNDKLKGLASSKKSPQADEQLPMHGTNDPFDYSGEDTSSNPFAFKDTDQGKPNFSYIGLIAKAILSTKERRMVLSEIYQWILQHYPYFRTRGPGWRNSIRHNLSLNDCFIKYGRSANGKGHYWGIHSANTDDFLRGDFRRRRAQKKVRKALSILHDPHDRDSPPFVDNANQSHVPAANNFIQPLGQSESGSTMTMLMDQDCSSEERSLSDGGLRWTTTALLGQIYLQQLRARTLLTQREMSEERGADWVQDHLQNILSQLINQSTNIVGGNTQNLARKDGESGSAKFTVASILGGRESSASSEDGSSSFQTYTDERRTSDSSSMWQCQD